MRSLLVLFFTLCMAQLWTSTGLAAETPGVDIAQIPLASCLTDTTYRSATALSADSAGGVIYQAKYRTTDWSGQLLAFKVDGTGIVDSNADGTINASDALWEAGSALATNTTRKAYSLFWPDDLCGLDPASCQDKINRGIVFSWDQLTERQKNLLDGPKCYEQYLTEYLAGSRQYEKPNPGYNSPIAGCNNEAFRQRQSLLGDIVNSDPLFVGSEDFNYATLPGTEGSSYQAFVNQKSLPTGGLNPRPRMVYVGGNDGMLHGFEAGTWNRDKANAFDTGRGTEIFSFLPGNIVLDNLKLRAFDPFTAAQHRYLVDGSPRAGDAYFTGAWHTVLVGTTGGSPHGTENIGGRSIFALDITRPEDFASTAAGVEKVLWEFNDNANALDGFDIDLGMTLAQPSLARMQNGHWAVIVGNGYNSAYQRPVLYVFDVSLKPSQAGFLMAKITPCEAKSKLCPGDINGLSTPIPVDVDFDRKVDYIYAGDLQGNLWKFDMNCPNRDSKTGDDSACQTSTASNHWTVANNGNPLFVACSVNGLACNANNRQPITAKPQVGSVSPDQANALFDANKNKPSVMVYFGTGKFLGVSDREASSNQQQSFYGLWDYNTGNAATDNTIAGRNKLLQQTILATTVTRKITKADGTEGSQTLTNVRVTSNSVPCYKASCTTKDRGWFMDLTTPADLPSERSVSFPLLLNGNALFTTFVPSPDPCATSPQGGSWLMEVDAITGARPATSPFDLFGGSLDNAGPDNKFNQYDMVIANSTTMAPSGIKSSVGTVKTPALVYGKGVINKHLGGASGDAQMVTDPGAPLGRVSWRQLR